MTANVFLCAFLGLIVLASPMPSPTDSEARSKLRILLDEAWEFELREDPLFATAVGDSRFDDRLPAVGVADQARRAGARRKLRERLVAIDPAGLDETERESYALFRVKLEDAIRDFELHGYRFPINADSGFHMDFAQLTEQMPFDTTRDYENYIARLRAFPEYARQNTELLREGLQTGWTLPKAALKGYEKTIEAHVVAEPGGSRFFKPFAAFPGGVPEADRARLRAAGEKAIREDVVPAYRAFLEFMTRDYMPRARATVGAGDMEGAGSTTPTSSGTSRRSTGRPSRSTRSAWRRSGGSAPRWRRSSGRPVSRQLRRLPEVPAHRPALLREDAGGAAEAGGVDRQAHRRQASVALRPASAPALRGRACPRRDRSQVHRRPLCPGSARRQEGRDLLGQHLRAREPAALHPRGAHAPRGRARPSPADRAVGGADGPAGLPPFLYVDAFGEGWGLYSERLGLEMGLYTDPYSNFGRLTYEMWRACRLVVDTGMHAKGWTRAAGDRLPGVQHGPVAPRVHDGDRPLHLLAGPGARLQDGGAEAARAAPAGRGGARAPLRHPRVPRPDPGGRHGHAADPRDPHRRLHPLEAPTPAPPSATTRG